ncbi:MAG: leucine-rich repeat domain-containing protein, partial [Muribaculaceae bacterium]|nr:leucine-rich repeat domain-containing protein [Muribaculaceae bacterium]
TYTVQIADTTGFGGVEEISFGPGFAPGSYRLYSAVNGHYLAPANLMRINLYSFHEPSSESGCFTLNIGESGKAVSADAYFEAPGKTVVRVNEFNVYGPDGNKLQPFLMADGKPDIRRYPDSDGMVRLGDKFKLDDGTYMTVLPMSQYTIVYLYVEYEGKLAAIRINASPISKESFSPADDNLAYAFSNMGGVSVLGFATDADASGDVVIPASVMVGDYRAEVEGIADKAFMRTGITSVKLPGNMSSIGAGAFYACPGLESVEFADNSGICALGSEAFAYCESLSSVSFNNCSGRINLGSGIFNGTPALKSINLMKGQYVASPVNDAGLSGLLDAEILENTAELVKVRVASHFCDSEGNVLPVCAFTRVRRPEGYRVNVFKPVEGIVALPKEAFYNESANGSKDYNGMLMFGYGEQDDPYLANPVADGDRYAACIFTHMQVPEEGLPQSVLLDNVSYVKTEDGCVAVMEVNQENTSLEGVVYVPAKIGINGKEYGVTSVAAGALADCSGIKTLSLPEACTAAGIFAPETEEMELPDSGVRDLGPLSLILTAVTQDAISIAISSGIYCGTDIVPVCAAIETATGLKAYYPADGVVTIPLADFAAAESAPARSGFDDAHVVHIGFADNAMLPGVNDGIFLHTVYVASPAGSGVENVSVDMSGDAEYYDVRGIRVSGELRSGGIYIRRDSREAQKVLVK